VIFYSALAPLDSIQILHLAGLVWPSSSNAQLVCLVNHKCAIDLPVVSCRSLASSAGQSLRVVATICWTLLRTWTWRDGAGVDADASGASNTLVAMLVVVSSA